MDCRIGALGLRATWPAMLADFDSLTRTEVEQDGKRFFVHSDPWLVASAALRAAGIALPPTIEALAST